MVYLPGILLDVGSLLGLLVVVGAVTGALGFRRFALTSTGLAAFGFLTVFLTPIDAWISGPLEAAFPPPPSRDGPAGPIDGIVVLGGATRSSMTAYPSQLGLAESAERHVEFAALADRFPDARLVVSGFREAPAPIWLLREAGIDLTRLEIEGTSRTTAENISEILRTVRPACGERWLVVTSAAHMPRTVALAQTHGWPIIPWPVDYQSLTPKPAFMPRQVSDALQSVSAAAHEWIGLAAYRLLGKTDRFWPAPLGSIPCQLTDNRQG